jgi:hypothetical protein
MLDRDKPEFVRILNGLAAIKPGAKLTPEALDVWWLALQDWPIDQFKAAAGHIARNVEFFPSPYHFEQLRRAEEPTAGEAFAAAIAHAASGAWRHGGTGRPEVDRAVRAIGGWHVIAMGDEDKLHFLERRFTEHFDAIQDSERVRDELPMLAGPSHRPAIKGPQSASNLLARFAREDA